VSVKKEPFEFINRWKLEAEVYKKCLLDPAKGEIWPRKISVEETTYEDWKSLVVDPATQEYYRSKKPKYTPAEDGSGTETRTIEEIEAHEVVRQITRVRTEDGSEYLITTGALIGYDEFGEEKRYPYYAKEKYMETLFDMRTEQDPSVNRLRQVCKGPNGFKEHYLIPFNEKNVRKLYEKRDKSRCNLVVQDAVSLEAKQCLTLDMFITKDFEYIKNDGFLTEKEREERRKDYETMMGSQRPIAKK